MLILSRRVLFNNQIYIIRCLNTALTGVKRAFSMEYVRSENKAHRTPGARAASDGEIGEFLPPPDHPNKSVFLGARKRHFPRFQA